MARIRSIKPELPHSESMGRVSRDARLLFIMLFTIVDDEGRARAASRMLASLLFPYDDDAPLRIPEWMIELERQNCVIVYAVDGNTYLQIVNWTSHQRIDKPTKSKLPEPADRKKSRDRSKSPREGSRPLQDNSPLDKEGIGKDQDQEGIIARSAVADETAVAVLAYNVVAEECTWPEAKHITPGRLSKLKERLKEAGGIEGWNIAMAKARASPFLRGTSGRNKGHEKWVPDLDFFIQQSSFTKLMEGKYDDRHSNSEPTGFAAILAGARAAAAE